jgi:hypothetical protein
MKSDIDIKDDVYKVICHSELHGSVNGVLSKRKRPHNSQKEDIIISVLANQQGQKQESYVNVNVYVQDDDINGQKEENSVRLRELCQLCLSFFEFIHGDDYRLSLDAQTVIASEDSGEHIINNKLLYQTLNED